jgi:integrating conjugative element protein (TIGR03761 family)
MTDATQTLQEPLSATSATEPTVSPTVIRKRRTDRADISKEFNPEAVRPLIQHLLNADNPDIDDPFFGLFTQYEAWQETARLRRANYKSTLGAEATVPMQTAQQMWDIGRLESEGDDFMMIHTKDAMRLFIGRGEDPDGKVSRIPGAKSVGTALRHFWFASGANNPYADWALLMAEQGLDQRIASLETSRQEALAKLKALEQQGLHLSVLRSSHPVRLDLGFKSPYGFLIAHMVVVFDHFVRIIKTLQARDLLSVEESRIEIRRELRPLRALFDQLQRQEALLNRPVFNGLKRADFESTSGDVRQRITQINDLWPGLPADVLSGQVLPRHARRVVMSVVASSDSGEVDGDLL